LGIKTAMRGEKPDCSARVPNTLSKKMKIKATPIPKARLIPMPPRRFAEDTATPMMVRIKAVTGKAQRLYFTRM